MTLLLAAALAVSAALGFVAGRSTRPPEGLEDVLRELAAQRALLEGRVAGPAASPEQVRCAVAAPAGAAVDMAMLRTELANVLRETLGERPAVARVPEPPAVPSPESVAALQEAHRLVDDARRAGRWREEDAQAMRRLLSRMTESQSDEAIRRLIVTMNAGGLEMQARDMPF